MNVDIIIYGIGPLAQLMHFYFSNDSLYNVVAFTVDAEYLSEDVFCGLPVVPFGDIEDNYATNDYGMFVAVGYKNMNNRKIMYDKAKEKGYELVNYISSNAVLYNDLVIGDNNVIMGQVNIEPFVKIGSNNIFWSNTLLGHNLTVGNHNYISACCLLGGDCTIGNFCFICNGAGMINDLNIKDNTKILPGSMMYKNSKEYGQYVGVPAKIIKAWSKK